MKSNKLWKDCSGVELKRAYIRGDELSDLVSNSPAIYLWRRNFLPSKGIASNAHEMRLWVTECLTSPYAEVPAQSLAHFLSLRGISIGGGGLTEEKQAKLKVWLQDMGNRLWLREFLGSLNDFCPPLYVGETKKLARRIKEHLAGDTDFAKILEDKIKITWDKLWLLYLELPDQFSPSHDDSKELRTLMEMIASRLAIAGCTTRPG